MQNFNLIVVFFCEMLKNRLISVESLFLFTGLKVPKGCFSKCVFWTYIQKKKKKKKRNNKDIPPLTTSQRVDEGF